MYVDPSSYLHRKGVDDEQSKKELIVDIEKQLDTLRKTHVNPNQSIRIMFVIKSESWNLYSKIKDVTTKLSDPKLTCVLTVVALPKKKVSDGVIIRQEPTRTRNHYVFENRPVANPIVSIQYGVQKNEPDISSFDKGIEELFDTKGMSWSDDGVNYHQYTRHDVKSVDDTLIKECVQHFEKNIVTLDSDLRMEKTKDPEFARVLLRYSSIYVFELDTKGLWRLTGVDRVIADGATTLRFNET